MIKFRSMIINADKSGVDSTSANDTRITPLGHFIRKYKIDELPNFFNILIGEIDTDRPLKKFLLSVVSFVNLLQ